MSWADRANELLYDGESIRDAVDVGEHRVFVTSHRLLAFTPTVESGANYRAVDLPNVTDVTDGGESDTTALKNAVAWGVLGLVLVVGGIVFEMGNLFTLPQNLESGAAGGTGGIVSGFQTLVSLLSLLDEAFAVVGVGIVAVAGFYAYRYRQSRTAVVTIGVAGDADVRLPVSSDDATSDEADPGGASAMEVAAVAADEIRDALGAATGSSNEY